ncbi:FAD-binding oxidoreductase [Microbispora sp. H13382]|uniref:FAD-binding oxidoreductase n=1 Tax=Microbispora sp. H13382 TaxID=2729112 RepID=UPI001602AC48|nr:FAD-binding oxidoreductase [Microbispora sp. H13382]
MSQHVQRQAYQARQAGPGDGPAVARDLRRDFAGAVHLPGDAAYDALREAPYSSIDPRPALIAEATSPADVRAAIVAARDSGLPFAVQATGHGTQVACDGGLLLRTGAMGSVLVDPAQRIARVGPGVMWQEVTAAAEPFGLAPLAGPVPSVGVTGYTLGGGFGWLARKYGFAADSVVRAEVVTAEGHIVAVGPDRHPDLFWALRGGGGNFGVVTSLEFRLHPVARVHAGTAFFAADRAAETLAFYRDWIAGAPDELSTAILITRMPHEPGLPPQLRGRRVIGIQAMYAGEADEARRFLRPLWAAAGPALLDTMRTTPFGHAMMGGTAPMHVELLPTLPDPVIETLVRAGERPGSPVTTVEIRHWGGAIAAAGPDAGPVAHRSVPLSVVIDAHVPEIERALRPHVNGGTFLNFLHDPARTEAAYTPDDWRRLREVKRAYDPDNFFHVNLNVPPAG